MLAALDEIAKARGASMASVAIAWLLHQPAVSSVILGVHSLAQLEDNLAAVEVSLSADEFATLDRASAPAPAYPGWMSNMHNVGRSELLRTRVLPKP